MRGGRPCRGRDYSVSVVDFLSVSLNRTCKRSRTALSERLPPPRFRAAPRSHAQEHLEGVAA